MKASPSDIRFVLSLLAVSLGTNAFLAYRLRHPPSAAEAVVCVGQRLPPAEVTTLDGRRELIRYADERQPTVLYVFSPSCHFCAANLESIKYLFQARGAAYRFVGVSVQSDGLAAYARASGVPFSVYAATPGMQSAYSLAVVPQTLLIEPSGRVVQAWTGAYVGTVRREVEKFFQLSLPSAAAAAS